MKTTISTKLSLFLLLASLIPLLSFGIISVYQVRQATMQSVREGHQNVIQRAAEQIEQYVKNAISILEATAENINQAGLQPWQEERILENYISRFDEFNELSLFDEKQKEIATTRLGKNDISYQKEALTQTLGGQFYISPVYIKEDLSPAMKVAFPVKKLTQVTGVLIGEINLMHMWYLVDHIKIGESGVLSVIGVDGRLIASGNGIRKKEIFSQNIFEPKLLWKSVLQPQGVLYQTSYGEKVLAVGFQISDPLGWIVIVEQPISEAYVLTHQMTRLLLWVMTLFVIVALGIGLYVGHKQVLNPIHQLNRATQELAQGNLNYHISISTGDEFEVLAEAFNEMIIKLKDIQQKLVIQERHALFGRVASGLAHDLKHPIQAIETTSRLMEKMYDDEEFRLTFRRTVEREFEKINLFLKDLHNLVHDSSFHPMPVNVCALVQDSLDTFQTQALAQNVKISFEAGATDISILGERPALNRVFSNMISNALQAMPRGGELNIKIKEDGEACEISFSDTGVGIEAHRLKTLFDDFVTTKSQGLGLGLAITKKIVSTHQGSILVTSEEGRGSCFAVRLPLSRIKTILT